MSRYITHSDQFINLSGTHLQGYVTASYDELVALFGEPEEGDGDKTQAEWDLEFWDGTVAAIYDWKSSVRPEFETTWNIGGHNYNAVLHVESELSMLRAQPYYERSA